MGFNTDEKIEKAKKVQAAHENDLLKRPGVVGVGIGFRQRDGHTYEDEVVLVVRVQNKRPLDDLDDDEVLPDEIDGIPIDIQSTGTPGALSS